MRLKQQHHKLIELITDPGTGGLSHTRLWANIGYSVGTAAFLRQVWNGGLTADLLLVYLGIVTSSAAASKIISMKYGNGNGAAPGKGGK